MEEENKQIPFDLACYNFNQALMDLINNANLPATAVYYILKDNLQQVENIRNKIRLDQQYQELGGQAEYTKTVEGQIENIEGLDDLKKEATEDGNS